MSAETEAAIGGAGSAGATLAAGRPSMTLQAGAIRGLAFDGVAVVRTIDRPIRYAAWRTLPVEGAAALAPVAAAVEREA